MARPDWIQTKIKLDAKTHRRAIALTDATGWSLDTVMRRSMRDYASRVGVALEGGDEIASRREDADDSPPAGFRIWVSYPGAWSAVLSVLLEASPIHTSIASMWREALVATLEEHAETEAA